MRENTENHLSGADNSRLNSVNATNSEGTAAWSNRNDTYHETNVNIPDNYYIEKAKNWVDNGSKL